jgi:hypothetical protein
MGIGTATDRLSARNTVARSDPDEPEGRAVPAVQRRVDDDGDTFELKSASTGERARYEAFLRPTPAQSSSTLDARVAQYERDLSAFNGRKAAYGRTVDQYWERADQARKAGAFGPEQPPARFTEEPPKDPRTGDAPPTEEEELSTIPDQYGAKDGSKGFLQAARDEYGFEPEPPTTDEDEKEFEWKKEFARQALDMGFTANQVVGDYAFETGGDQNYDEQPKKMFANGEGPASTALTYAGLLTANTVDMIAQHGETLAREMEDIGKPEKARVLRAMMADAQTIPTDVPPAERWELLKDFGKTDKGRAMHAMLLDKDVGPRIAMQKLKSALDAAAEKGMRNLSPADLALVNLAGNDMGTKMLGAGMTSDQKRAVQEASTSYFFDRAGWDRNPIVKYRTVGRLRERIGEVIAEKLQKPGSQEFYRAFADVQAERDRHS